MEFQMWRDYLQLASVIQDIAKAEISGPPPFRDLLLNPTKRGEHRTMNEKNPCVQLNSPPLTFTPSQLMDSSYHKNCPNLLPAHFYGKANPPPHSAPAFQTHKTQPQSLPTYSYGQTISLQTKTSVRQKKPPRGSMCCFCKHNGESRHIYMGHNLKDEQGNVVCPVLRMYACSLCGAEGDKSHTKKYCPLNKEMDRELNESESN